MTDSVLEGQVLGWVHDAIRFAIVNQKQDRKLLLAGLGQTGLPPRDRLRLRHLLDGRMLLVLGGEHFLIRCPQSGISVALWRGGKFGKQMP